MSSFNSVLELLNRPPGSLAYHVIALFALEAMVGIAWEEWRRMRRQEYRQMSWGFLGLLGIRAIWMVLEAVRWRGAFDPNALAWLWPPLNDLMIVVTWGLLLWSSLPVLLSAAPPKRLPLAALVGMAVSLALYVISALVWRASTLYASPVVSYGGHWVAYMWAVIQVLIVGTAAFLVLFHSKEQRAWLITGFLVLLLGQIVRLVHWQLGLEGAYGWIRLAELVAFPLLALTVHQGVVSDLYSFGQEFKTVSEESLRQTRELLFML